MPTFTPPVRSYVPSVLPDTPSWQRSPAMYWKNNIPRGANVFKLLDGSYTETQPASWDQIGTAYYGGHAYVVSNAEAAALTTAGYGANIT